MMNPEVDLSEEDVELLTTDVSDAFFLVPLHVKERKFFVIRFRDVYYVFVTTAQGSRGAPLSWTAIASLVGRVAQSVFLLENGQQEGRLQIYVDDPLLAVRGSKSCRRLLAARFVAVLTLLGFRLAFDKAQFGQCVTWIGVQIHIKGLSVEATVPPEKVRAILEIVESMQQCNVITVKDLR